MCVCKCVCICNVDAVVSVLKAQHTSVVAIIMHKFRLIFHIQCSPMLCSCLCGTISERSKPQKQGHSINAEEKGINNDSGQRSGKCNADVEEAMCHQALAQMRKQQQKQHQQ